MLRKEILLLGNKKCFCHGVKNSFASRTQILRAKHMFPSLATPRNIKRNIVSATMFPSLAKPYIKAFNINAEKPKFYSSTVVYFTQAERLETKKVQEAKFRDCHWCISIHFASVYFDEN